MPQVFIVLEENFPTAVYSRESYALAHKDAVANTSYEVYTVDDPNNVQVFGSGTRAFKVTMNLTDGKNLEVDLATMADAQSNKQSADRQTFRRISRGTDQRPPVFRPEDFYTFTTNLFGNNEIDAAAEGERRRVAYVAANGLPTRVGPVVEPDTKAEADVPVVKAKLKK